MSDFLINAPDFRNSDFQTMVFPLHKHQMGEDILNEFPIFSNYTTFRYALPKGLPRESVILYVGFAFDQGSPFIKKYGDVLERRFWAAVQAGFNFIKGNVFHDDVEAMIRGKVKEVNNMIIQYAILQGNEEYTAYVAYNEALRSQLQRLTNIDAEEKEAKDVKTITDNIKVLRAQITEVRMNLFHSDEDRLLNTDLYDFMEAKGLGLSPEAYAERKKQSQNK